MRSAICAASSGPSYRVELDLRLHASEGMRRLKRVLFASAILIVGGLGVLQLVPYGRDHSNPPVVMEPAWDRPSTRALAVRACFDCHSNQTVWPWYSHVAPASWLVQNHVDEGREVLNFSEWTRRQEEAKEAAEEVREGEMPPAAYTLVHAHARLNPADRGRLAQGLATTLGATLEREARERHR